MRKRFLAGVSKGMAHGGISVAAVSGGLTVAAGGCREDAETGAERAVTCPASSCEDDIGGGGLLALSLSLTLTLILDT